MMVDSLGITLLLGIFGVLVVLRVPITFCLAISAIITGFYLNVPLEAIVKVMADGVMNFSLLAIPFFIIMGEIRNEGGIAQRLVNLANLLVGRLPGGLALVNLMDSMFFGGISGSAVADVSSLGSIVIPMMKKQGYDEEFSVGLTICSACQRCAACLVCVMSCPAGVPRINDRNVSEIDEALCQGCGICAAECPAQAIQLSHHEDDQVNSQVQALFEGVG